MEVARSVPVWYRDGMLCTGETYKSHVKVTFAKVRRSRIRRGLQQRARQQVAARSNPRREKLDEAGFKGLVKAAVALNQSKAAARKR
jgi:hypothetical protein